MLVMVASHGCQERTAADVQPAIQELAGHLHLATTQRYMHLSPRARENAIALLDARPVTESVTEIFGEILETGS